MLSSDPCDAHVVISPFYHDHSIVSWWDQLIYTLMIAVAKVIRLQVLVFQWDMFEAIYFWLHMKASLIYHYISENTGFHGSRHWRFETRKIHGVIESIQSIQDEALDYSEPEASGDSSKMAGFFGAQCPLEIFDQKMWFFKILSQKLREEPAPRNWFAKMGWMVQVSHFCLIMNNTHMMIQTLLLMSSDSVCHSICIFYN